MTTPLLKSSSNTHEIHFIAKHDKLVKRSLEVYAYRKFQMANSSMLLIVYVHGQSNFLG